MNNLEIGKKALITTDNWFIAPDGLQYRGVFGTIKAVLSAEETLGIKTNAKSTNWYVEIGNVTLAGCQIHYAIATDTCNTCKVTDTAISEGIAKDYVRPTLIYNAD